MIIGTNAIAYNQQRNFIDLPFTDVYFRKVFDIHKIQTSLAYKIRNKVSRISYRFNDFGLNNVDLYHFFNSITPVKKPWITTFEHTLPRQEPNFINGYKWMASPYCKKLIGLSQRAMNGQKYLLNMHPEFKGAIETKMICLPPSQRILSTNLCPINGTVNFCFVGNAFYRKGGAELVKAFASLTNRPVHLHLISKMDYSGFKDQFAEPFNQSMPKNITHYPWLPNEKVLEILRQSHVGILPSYGETYGYSILEAMAAGCAVVTTDVEPFPEFVKEEFGYFLHLPKYFLDGFERIDSDTRESYQACSADLTNEIIRVVDNIVHNLDTLQIKRNNAIKRIAEYHSPVDRMKILRAIYEEALEIVR